MGKRVLIPKTLIPTSLSVLLPASAIPTMENSQLKDEKVIASKKIKFYPENEKAYNLAIECYINDKYLDENGNFKNLRPQIKEQCKAE